LPGSIDAKLSEKRPNPKAWWSISGTITNRGTTPLSNVLVRTKNGFATVAPGPVQPGESVTVNGVTLDPKNKMFGRDENANRARIMRMRPRDDHQPDVSIVADLAADRAVAIDRILDKESNAACVYAEFSNPPDDVRLNVEGAKTIHAGVVRALVKLQ
jgi:hypothetical protein